MLLQNYNNKNILITGTTGFLGKVILEKFLRTLPHINKIYILIRVKKGQNPNNRFHKEILGSPLFQKLRQNMGEEHFLQYIGQKCQVVPGDLLAKEKVGLSAENYELLQNNLDIMINCAASVDFTAPLIDNIKANVLGTLGMFELANGCKNLLNFIHVSTAYVNSNKVGEIEEIIYDEFKEDPEEMINRFLKMDPEVLVSKTKEILGTFPNSYTFTKSIVERIIQKRRRKDMTVTIVRPSIIGSMDIEDPYKGWVEGFTSCTAAFCLIGIGLIRHSPSPPKVIGDLIPVNYISDYVILVGNYLQNKQQLTICHSTSSDSKIPCYWDFTNIIVREYWTANKTKKSQPVNVTQHNSKFINRMHIILNQQIPAIAYNKIANLTQNKAMLKNAALLNKGIKNVLMVDDLFGSLASRTWIYKAPFKQNILKLMSEEEKKVFNIDTDNIDWFDFLLHYQYGIQRFIMKIDIKPPNMADFLTPQNEWYFRQLKWAYKQWDYIENKDGQQQEQQTIQQKYIQQQNLNNAQLNSLTSQVNNKMNKTPANQQEGIQYFSKL